MTLNNQKINDFYTKLFTNNPSYSRPFPNPEEACRLSKIIEFLSQIPKPMVDGREQQLRILDVGCGRGWLTKSVNLYGCCEGVNPVPSSIELARRYFPELTFYIGTAADVVQSSNFKPYDVVITSEVIEHVIDKESFVAELAKCLVPNGYIIITTPRGEEFKKYKRLGWELQPIESWISEKDVCSLFERHQFVPIKHDRAYFDIPNMSLLHRLSASPKFYRVLHKLRLVCIHKALQYITGIYQVWCFQAKT